MRIIAHFMMGGMIGIHVFEFTMRTGVHPVTYAARVILWGRRDEAALAMMTMMTVMSAMLAVMM